MHKGESRPRALIKHYLLVRLTGSQQNGATVPRRNRPMGWNREKTRRGLWKFVPQPSTSHNNSVLAHPPLHPIFACAVITSHGLMTPHPLSSAQSFRLGKSTTSLHHHCNLCFTLIFFFFLAVNIIHNHINFSNVLTEDDSQNIFMLYPDPFMK